MKFTISDRLDFRYEALCLLERIATHRGEASSMHSTIDAYCSYYLGEYSLTDAESAQIEAVRDAGRRVEEKLTISQEDLSRYFIPLPETDLSLAGVLFLMHSMFNAEGPDDASLINAILTLVDADDGKGESQPATFQDFTTAVSALSIPAETKWACIEIFLNYTSLHDSAMEFISSAASLFEGAATQLQAPAAACAAQLATWDASDSLDAMFREKGLTLDAADLEIIPCAMRFSAISLFSTDCIPNGQEHIVIRYGMLFDLLDAKAETQRSESDELLRFAKALADKTRMQILFALKEAPLYAQDVVSLTGLSAATVSHHMSELASAGFVALEKQGTRILYRLLPAKINRLSSLLKSLAP